MFGDGGFFEGPCHGPMAHFFRLITRFERAFASMSVLRWSSSGRVTNHEVRLSLKGLASSQQPHALL